MVRTCRACNVEKPVSEFYQRRALCKPCEKAKQIASRLPDTATRVCATCGVKKSILEYAKNHRMAGGYVNNCKPCYSIKESKRRWGFDNIYEEIEGRLCEICSRPLGIGTYNFAVDHDHKCCPGTRSCGKCIRGFLCAPCNHGLGKFKDSPDLLAKAILYLERHDSRRNKCKT